MYPALDGASIWRHITTVEDTEVLRAALPGLGLVGFVGDGAILPRKRCDSTYLKSTLTESVDATAAAFALSWAWWASLAMASSCLARGAR